MENIIDTRSEEYKAGANDLWKYIKAVYSMSPDLRERLFNNHTFFDDILDNYTGTEVLKRIKEYLESIIVGDVIFNDLTKTQAIVTFIDTFGQWQCVNSKGLGFVLDVDEQQYWTKIGHNDEVVEALKRLEIQFDH